MSPPGGRRAIERPCTSSSSHRTITRCAGSGFEWLRATSGIIGLATTEGFALSSNTETELSPEKKLEILLEAARRANWDAQHGPPHLRSGRYWFPDTHVQASQAASAAAKPAPIDRFARRR